MEPSTQIVWKGLDASAALAERIQHEIDQLSHSYRQVTRCRVVVDQPHQRHQRGRHFQVKIEVSVAGQMLCVTRDPLEHRNAEDPYAAVNEAFSTMRRQLEDYARVRRHLVKNHEGPGR